MNIIKRGIRGLARAAGYEITRLSEDEFGWELADLSAEEKRIVTAVRPFTMTSAERIIALTTATRHVSVNRVEGAIVECGVWRGGSTMAALLTLRGLADTGREVFLYDTYEGMPAPTDKDVSVDGVAAGRQLAQTPAGTGVWCYASIEDVKANVLSTGYPEARLHFVRGKVEETLPATLPSSIALLRLDTDWYESTLHELKHLFPLLHPRGVLIIDDYGHWQGARKAVDEFFQDKQGQYFFHRIDYTGRLIMRTHP